MKGDALLLCMYVCPCVVWYLSLCLPLSHLGKRSLDVVLEGQDIFIRRGRLVHKHCLGTWPAFFFFFLKERGRGTIRDNRGANEQDMSSMISR